MSSSKASLLKAYLSSSIGRKQIVSVTGLFMLIGFLIPHLGGNLFFFLGREAYNDYAYHLHELGPLLKVMEVVLLAAVLIHIVVTFMLVKENVRSRKEGYSGDVSSEKRSIATRTMPLTGGLILIFIILHLMTFKFGDAPPHPNGHKDVYEQTLILFSNPGWVACYVIFMVAVGLHVSHALKSGFQTFGLIPIKYKAYAERASLTLGLAMFILFGAIPVVAYFQSRAGADVTQSPSVEMSTNETSGQTEQDK